MQNEVGKVGLDQRVELEMGEGGIGFLCKEKLVFESLVAVPLTVDIVSLSILLHFCTMFPFFPWCVSPCSLRLLVLMLRFSQIGHFRLLMCPFEKYLSFFFCSIHYFFTQYVFL